jgi:hypothetical protein
MQISDNPQFRNARWLPYSNKNTNWQLPGEDGEKTVDIRYKDEAGNITETVSDKIVLDRTPPMIGSVKINNGDRITNNANKTIVLNLEAEDAKQMMISNRYDFFDAEWENYAEKRDWVLQGPDGLKTVYVKFKDAIGNISKVAYAKIGVDRQAPREGRIQINDGGRYVTNINGYVDVKLYALDAREMRLAQDEALENYEWEPYQYLVQDFLLKGDDGEKKVYVQFRDGAGNETSPIVASVIMDRQQPYDESITINNGDKYTNTKDNRVRLSLQATDATEMIVGHSRKFTGQSSWEPYAENKLWALNGLDGPKEVWVKFRDQAGNESKPIKGDIILDTEAPIARFMEINGKSTLTDNTKVELTIKADNADFMMISNYPNFDGSIWEEYKTERVWELLPGPGLKKVYIKFKDKAQNETPSRYSTITLDDKPLVNATGN